MGVLAELIRGEIDRPGSVEAALDRLREDWQAATAGPGGIDAVLRFLALKDRRDRHALPIKVEHVLCRRMGWRLVRPLIALGILAAAGAMLQRLVDPSIALALFLGGTAGFYVVLQLYLHRWAWKEMRRLEGIESEYRRRLHELLEEVEP